MLIASRKLWFKSEGDDKDVEIRVFNPEQHEKNWSCRYEIDWPNGTETSRIYGLDSMQALYLTLQQLGISVYFSDYHKSGNLVWERPGGGYGFPIPKNARDLLIGDDKIFEGDS